MFSLKNYSQRHFTTVHILTPDYLHNDLRYEFSHHINTSFMLKGMILIDLQARKLN